LHLLVEKVEVRRAVLEVAPLSYVVDLTESLCLLNGVCERERESG
jgi:hypothetical protein